MDHGRAHSSISVISGSWHAARGGYETRRDKGPDYTASLRGLAARLRAWPFKLAEAAKDLEDLAAGAAAPFRLNVAACANRPFVVAQRAQGPSLPPAASHEEVLEPQPTRARLVHQRARVAPVAQTTPQADFVYSVAESMVTLHDWDWADGIVMGEQCWSRLDDQTRACLENQHAVPPEVPPMLHGGDVDEGPLHAEP